MAVYLGIDRCCRRLQIVRTVVIICESLSRVRTTRRAAFIVRQLCSFTLLTDAEHKAVSNDLWLRCICQWQPFDCSTGD